MKKQIFDAMAGMTLFVVLGVPLALVTISALITDALQSAGKRA